MKVYASNQSLKKIKNIIETQKPGTISIRKSKHGDPVDNIFKDIKLPDKYKAAHKTGTFYSFYINNQILKEIICPHNLTPYSSHFRWYNCIRGINQWGCWNNKIRI